MTQSSTDSFSKKLTRRKFLSLSALAGFGGLGYMRFWEPHWLKVRRQQIATGQGVDIAPLKLLQISDLHASDVVSLDYIKKAIVLGLAEKPDLICLTGDFITSLYEKFDGYAEILAMLVRQAPAYAILGNHDGGTWAARTYGYPDSESVRGMLAAAGIELLHNTHRDMEIGGRKLRLVGLGDKWSDELFPLQAFPSEPAAAGVFTIVLSHNPDTKDDLAGFPWDLMLSGHTHGGQLLIPLAGAPFAPVRDKRFIEGLHRWNDRWLHISKGVGNLHGMRLNCRPEVNLLTLV